MGSNYFRFRRTLVVSVELSVPYLLHCLVSDVRTGLSSSRFLHEILHRLQSADGLISVIALPMSDEDAVIVTPLYKAPQVISTLQLYPMKILWTLKSNLSNFSKKQFKYSGRELTKPKLCKLNAWWNEVSVSLHPYKWATKWLYPFTMWTGEELIHVALLWKVTLLVVNM